MPKFNIGDKVKIVRRYLSCSTGVIEHENEVVTIKSNRPCGKSYQYQLEEYPTEETFGFNHWWSEGCFERVGV